MLRKIEDRRRRGQHRIRWLDVLTNSMNVSLSKLEDIVKDRKVWYAAVHGVMKSQTGLALTDHGKPEGPAKLNTHQEIVNRL